MSGTHGERAFTCLKGWQGSHCYSCYGLLISWYVQTLCILLLFRRVAVMISTRHSYLGIPSPSKRGLLRDLLFIFSRFRLEAKHPPSATVLFLQQEMLCCRVLQWRFLNTTSRIYLLEDEGFFPLGDQLGSPWSIFQILALGQPIFLHLQCSIPQ